MNARTPALPEFYDDAKKSLDEVWRLIGIGLDDRTAPFHTLTFVTHGTGDHPQARTVVLRGADRDSRTIRFQTDVRSAKIAEIAENDNVALLFYDPGAKVQLRISGRAAVHRSDRIAETAWAGTRAFSRECYRVIPAPGSTLDNPGDVGFQSAGPDGDAGREVFCAVTIEIQTLEWYYLASQGHRRLLFDWRSGSLNWTWLVP